jgi:hypothetical protein
MLLNTPKEAALAEVGELCRELADYYRDAAEAEQPEALRALLRSLAGSHDHAAAEIEARVRATGELPRMPDPEREALAEMAERIKGLFADDQRDALLEARMHDETRLLDAVHEALAHQPDEQTRDALVRVRGLAQESIERLVAERAAGAG